MTNFPCRAAIAAGATLTVGAAMPAAASAAPGVITGASGVQHAYVAAPGTDSDLTISGANGRWVFADAGVSEITVNSAECSHGASLNVVTCASKFGPLAQEWIYVALGDGDDRAQIAESAFEIDPRAGFFELKGGDGEDYLAAHSRGNVKLNGGAGGDVLIGGAGIDTFLGGAGNDLMRGGAGADIVDGGPDRDSFTYASEGRTKGVRAVLDGVTPSGADGVDGDGDRLTAVEDVSGTPYTDILIGNAANNVLRGNGGVDQLTGLAGDDTLIATGGPSWLDGGDGNDLLQAKNTFKDMLGCGTGADTARVDPTELFVPFASCETLTS